MTMKNIRKQVQQILDGSAAQIRGEGERVAKKVRATVDATRTLGLKKISELAGDLSPADLMSRFGSLTFTELFERIRKSELARHADVIRQEVLAFLRLPTSDQMESLQASVDKLTKEVAALKALRGEVKTLQGDLKALKTAAQKGEKTPEPTAG